MPTKQYKAVVIGCGGIGAQFHKKGEALSHAQVFSNHEKIVLKGLCDKKKSVAGNASKKWKAASYTDLNKCLKDTSPDIVSICVPTDQHKKIFDEVSKYPSVKAIVIEKPIAGSHEDAVQIIQKAARRGIHLYVNYPRRYLKANQEIRKEVKNQSAGKLIKVCGKYTKGILGNGCHMLDWVFYTLGDFKEFELIGRPTKIKNDFGVDINFKLKQDNADFLLIHINDPATSIFELDIIFEKKRFRFFDTGFGYCTSNKIKSSRYKGYSVLAESSLKKTELEQSMQLLADSIITNLNGHKSNQSLAWPDEHLYTESVCHLIIEKCADTSHE